MFEIIKEKNIKKNIALLLMFLFVVILGRDNLLSWIVVALTTYNIIFNNSIQTIGLFISSNKENNILHTLLFFGSIFVFSVVLSWFLTSGGVHYHLLDTIDYKENHINILFIFLPLMLYFFTKKRIPVSATFLVIPLFANKDTIENMINKTSVSYLLSFIVSLMVYNFLYKKYKDIISNEKENTSTTWIVAEYISTGVLWFSWLTISLCNFVVFLPRNFYFKDILLLSLIGIITIYCILISRGGEMQKIITQKSDVKNIKTTVIFNTLFSFMLLFIQHINTIPVTSTWMFLGILAGREIAISINTFSLTGALKYKIRAWSKILLFSSFILHKLILLCLNFLEIPRVERHLSTLLPDILIT